MQKTYLYIVGSVVGLIIILFIVCNGCDNGGNSCSCIKRDVRSYADDELIDVEEYKKLCEKIDSHPEECNPNLKDPLNMAEYANQVTHHDSVIVIIPKEVHYELENIRFFIETSASMKGYMHGSTDFQNIVNNLIANIQGQYYQIPLIPSTIDSDIKPYKDKGEFSEHITQGKFQYGQHSPLHDVFEVILDSTGMSDISVFVTDGIMSGTNEQIRSNREYNVQQRNGMLRVSITDAFINKADSIAVAVFGFTSNFNCSNNDEVYYYDYQNQRHVVNFTNRPFYIFVIGNKCLLPDFIKHIKKHTDFNPEKELFFNTYEQVKDGKLFISHIRDRKNCFIEGEVIKYEERPSEYEPMRFAVGFDLRGAPDCTHDPGYLKNNCVIFNDDLDIELGSEIYFGEIDRTLLNELRDKREKDKIHNCTHYAEFEIFDIINPRDTLAFYIDYQLDDWYKHWSSDDDRNITASDNRTFNFEYLIKGFESAFERTKRLIEIKAPLRMEN